MSTNSAVAKSHGHGTTKSTTAASTTSNAALSLPEIRDNVFTYSWIIELARDIHDGKLRLDDVAAPLPQESPEAFKERTSALFRQCVLPHKAVFDAVPKVYMQVRDDIETSASPETDLLFTSGEKINQLRLKNSYIVELIDGLSACRRAISSGSDLTADGNEQLSERFKRLYASLSARNAFPAEEPLSPFEREIEETFERLRGFLIDTGLRANPFINWRPSTGDRGLEIVGESSERIFRQLVDDHLTLDFKPAPTDPAAEEVREDNLDMIALRTAYDESKMVDRLLGSHQHAKSFIDNRGENALYVALGMLHWTSEDEPTEVRKAPLILVPAELHRENATTPFHVAYCGDELEENRPLAKRLAEEFGIQLPALSTELDPQWYFDQVRTALGRGSRFSVHENEIVVDFFPSSARMYEDLDSAAWRPNARPWKHPLTISLFGGGFSQVEPRIPLDGRVDEHVDLDRDISIFGCDGSQERALVHANDGQTEVLIGPPGSGKSFAIAEFLAQAAARGKTVLFESAKAAALEVVVRRLDNMGLGDIALAVPRHDVTKRTILDSLRSAVALGEPEAKEAKAEREEFRQVRDSLNRHADGLSAVVEGTGLSAYDAAGSLLTSAPPAATFTARTLRELNTSRYPAVSELINEIAAELSAHGYPNENPFNGSKRTAVSAAELADISGRLTKLATILPERNELLAKLCNVLSLDVPNTTTSVTRLTSALSDLLKIKSATPELSVIADVKNAEWYANREEIASVLSAGERLAVRSEKWSGKLKDSAWDDVTSQLKERFERSSGHWYRFFSVPYWKMRGEIDAHFSAAPTGDAERRDALTAIVDRRLDSDVLDNPQFSPQNLFGPMLKTDSVETWNERKTFFDAMCAFEGKYRTFPSVERLRASLGSLMMHDIAAEITSLSSQDEAVRVEIENVVALIQFDPVAAEKVAGTVDIASQVLSVESLLAGVDKLASITRLNVLHNALSAEKCGELYETAVAGNTPEELPDALRYAWIKARLDMARESRPGLRAFDAAKQNDLVSGFIAADKAMQDANARALMRKHWEGIPRIDAGGQVGTLNRELSKRSRNKPIAELFAEAPRAIQAIKPIMLMTPRAAAEFLPRTMHFDYYVGDEESQKELVAGLGGMMRASHALVVGDNQQMAPSKVFKRGNSDENPSVLDQFIASRSTQFMLTGSYRFADPTLVQCSNVRFYGGRLRVFPAPFVGRTEKGIKYEFEENRYEGGGVNSAEASKVAARVMQHAVKTPELSLGVAAFSQEQASLILKEVEKLRRKTPELESFFAVHPDAPFSVKNLENVQGDEHDVMFISTAYGKGANGKLRLNFGTLNQPGGEKGLNVLFTRAKQRCEIFTAIDPGEIDLRGIQSEGVKAFKAYLDYAKTGVLDGEALKETSPLSEFESAIKARLENLGYEVHERVGTSTCHVNLAVVDPRDPSKYVLGILTDGAQYQKAHSARERNRINEEVLSSLGWQLRREWVLDWVDNVEEASKNIENAIQVAMSSGPVTPQKPVVHRDIARSGTGAIEPARGAPYVFGAPELDKPLPFDEIAPQTLARLAREIVAVEGPVHQKEVLRRLRDATKVERMTVAVEEALSNACETVGRNKNFVQRGEFFYNRTQDFTVRDRSAFHASTKKVELIAPEEIELAVLKVVEHAMGVRRQDIPLECVKMLGFKSLPQDANEIITPIVDDLVRSASVFEEEGRIVLKPMRLAAPAQTVASKSPPMPELR